MKFPKYPYNKLQDITIDHHVLDVVGFIVESVGDQGRYFVFTVVSRDI